MHHFVSLPTDLKIRKNESYLRTPHEHRNSLPLPKMLFSEFVSSKTKVHTGTSLDFCYCIFMGWVGEIENKVHLSTAAEAGTELGNVLS